MSYDPSDFAKRRQIMQMLVVRIESGLSANKDQRGLDALKALKSRISDWFAFNPNSVYIIDLSLAYDQWVEEGDALAAALEGLESGAYVTSGGSLVGPVVLLGVLGILWVMG